MMEEKESLAENHPGKWAVMGVGGVVALGDSIEEVLAEAWKRGLDSSEIELDLLDINLSIMPL